MSEVLHAAMLAAHEANDSAALVRLYTQAADLAAETTGDVDAACFFLTHAYIFALESGAAEAPALRARLVAHGRELPVQEDVEPERALSQLSTFCASASGGKTG